MVRISYSVSTDLTSLEEIKKRIKEIGIALGLYISYEDKEWLPSKNWKWCHMWFTSTNMSLNIDIYELAIRGQIVIHFFLDAAENIIEDFSKIVEEDIVFYFGSKVIGSKETILSEVNVEAYRHLNTLENTLRCCIESKMKNAYGDKWLEQVPKDIVTKWKNRMEEEKKIRWIEVSPSLIAYSDFVDVKLIIEQPENWENYFKDIFGRKKEIIVGRLVELEQIRNKIAHSRSLSINEFSKFKSYCDEIIKCIKV